MKEAYSEVVSSCQGHRSFLENFFFRYMRTSWQVGLIVVFCNITGMSMVLCYKDVCCVRASVRVFCLVRFVLWLCVCLFVCECDKLVCAGSGPRVLLSADIRIGMCMFGYMLFTCREPRWSCDFLGCSGGEARPAWDCSIRWLNYHLSQVTTLN
jgi:hypothetical protein